MLPEPRSVTWLLFFTGIPILINLIANNSTRFKRILAFLDLGNTGLEWGTRRSILWWPLGLGESRGWAWERVARSLAISLKCKRIFIFPIIGEELGLIGVVAVLGLLIYLVCRGLAIAWNAKDDFGRYLAFGIADAFCVAVDHQY